MNLPAQNTLFYGDNLEILRDNFRDETIDLIYLDPPFNSQRPYNILFRERSGTESRAQVEAFNDMWGWNSIRPEVMLQHIQREASPNVSRLVSGLVDAVGETPLMAYIVMMTARLVELHRVLKPTGSLYLHCDPNASHYLKIVLDAIFGNPNFRNEIIWSYGGWTHQKMGQFPRKHDVVLFYSKTSNYVFNPPSIAWTRDEYVKVRKQAIHQDEDGREYIFDERGSAGQKRYVDVALAEGRPVTTVWELAALTSSSKERLGYPTQKPLSLLERIIQASSNPGDIVLDPFCGCGTAVAAAEKLGRRWYGIDITHLAIAVQEQRLRDMFPGIKFQVDGVPKDLESARAMAERDYNGRAEFQYWAVSLVGGYPYGSQDGKKGKKGRDRGVDGYYVFFDEVDERKGKDVIIQVKSGKVKSGDIRDLRGTIERENASIGLFITLEPPSSEMLLEAYRAGEYFSPGWNQSYPRIQIVTINELLGGYRPLVPARTLPYKQAVKVGPTVTQPRLDISVE